MMPLADCSLRVDGGEACRHMSLSDLTMALGAVAAMCNGTWVCFDCRIAVRRRTWRLVTRMDPRAIGARAARVPCAKCGKASVFLGPTVEVPPKMNVMGWKRLRERVAQLRIEAAEIDFEDSVRWRHKLEQTIEELKARPRNAGRDRSIKSLKETLRRGYASWWKLREIKAIPSKLWKKNSRNRKKELLV